MRKITVLFLLALIIGSCSSLNKKGSKDQLTVSIWPQKYFLELLAGDEYDINVMVPESSSPAAYEPSPRQVHDLGNSLVYFAIGDLGFEKAWMEKFKSVNPDMLVVNTSRGISLIHDPGHGHNGTDPHFWMSPGACFQMAINMKEALTSINPGNAIAYEKNLSEIQKLVSDLDFQIRDMLADLNRRQFLIYHPSLSYYARDYNLEQLAIELHGKEPSLVYIREIIKRASQAGLKNIFAQQQFNTESAGTIASELGGKVILFNPLSYHWDEELISLTGKMILNNSGKDEQEAN